MNWLFIIKMINNEKYPFEWNAKGKGLQCYQNFPTIVTITGRVSFVHLLTEVILCWT